MFGKYGRNVVIHNESTIGEVVTRYPEWWLRSPEVGFTSWNAEGPYHGVLLNEEFSTMSPSLLDEKLRTYTGSVAGAWSLLAAFCSGALVMIAVSVVLKVCAADSDSKVADSYYYAV